MNTENVIAQRIREAREAKNMTQTELAEIIGSHVNVIWQYENAKRVPSLENGSKIAKILNIDLNFLMGLYDINNFKDCLIDPSELLFSIRLYFRDDKIQQLKKDKLFNEITKSYWESKMGKE